jgi:hypothetical protein
MGSGENIIEEEAKFACARPHSGIRLSVIDEVDNNSMKGDDRGCTREFFKEQIFSKTFSSQYNVVDMVCHMNIHHERF